MANGFNAQPSIRETPVGQRQSASAVARFVDSLPEERSFMERLSGDEGLNPGHPSGDSQIQALEQAIVQGELDEPRVQKLIRRNPLAASRFARALDASAKQRTRSDILQRNFSPGQPAGEPVLQEPFQGDGTEVFTPGAPAQPAKADLQKAILEATSRGDLGLAKELKEVFAKSGDSPFAKINPKDFTQKSVGTFERSNRFSDLVPAGETQNDPGKIAAHAKNLRGEFRTLSKTFLDVRDSFGRIQESAKDPSPAGDLSLIFNFMKMLDPESVVRESEFAAAAQSGSFGQRIQGAVAKALRGELEEELRNDFVSRAEALFKRQHGAQKKLETQYSGLARRLRVDPRDVVLDFSFTPPTPPGEKPALSPDERQRKIDELRRLLRGP